MYFFFSLSDKYSFPTYQNSKCCTAKWNVTKILSLQFRFLKVYFKKLFYYSNSIVQGGFSMEQQTYTIREMSERFGLPASTLRYYEEIGLWRMSFIPKVRNEFTPSSTLTAWPQFSVSSAPVFRLRGFRSFSGLRMISREILTRWLPFSKNMSRIYAKNRAHGIRSGAYSTKSAVLQCGSRCD